MEKHEASYTLATMDQRADVVGSAHVRIASMPDGEPRCLTVRLKAPARYCYVTTYCGRREGTGPRIAFAELLERHAALELLAEMALMICGSVSRCAIMRLRSISA